MTGSWASHHHQRMSRDGVAEVAGRPVVEGVAERGDQPERTETSRCGATAPPMGATAGACPRQPRQGVDRRQLDGAGSRDAERPHGRRHVAFDGDDVGAAVRARRPWLDQLAHGELDQLVIDERRR